MKLSIPTPCEADYSKMHRYGNTANCDLCHKNVHDLRGCSPSQLETFLLQHSEEELCVRLRDSQMNGTSSFWKVPMVLSIVTLSALGLASCQSVHSMDDKGKNKICKSNGTDLDSIATDSIYQEEMELMGEISIIYTDSTEHTVSESSHKNDYPNLDTNPTTVLTVEETETMRKIAPLHPSHTENKSDSAVHE